MAKEKAPLIRTPEYRGSYVNFVTPREIEPGKGLVYGVLMPFKRTDPETIPFIKRLQAEIIRCYAAEFGKEPIVANMPHYPIKNGDKDENQAFHGHLVIRASSRFKPGCADLAGNRLVTEDELYSGAWYRTTISVWAWNNEKGGKGCSINLHNSLKVRDDEKFGGGTRVEDDFADLIGKGGAAKADDLADLGL